MYFELNWSETYYTSIVYNSIELTDEISCRYQNLSIIRDSKINEML